ncbi:MAG: hypothetical protein ACRDQZ_18515 [Mycobacteriales bacterium]
MTDRLAMAGRLVSGYRGDMGMLGELFPGRKVGKDTPDEEGSGQGFDPGPLDLDSGVVYLRPRKPDADQDPPNEDVL